MTRNRIGERAAPCIDNAGRASCRPARRAGVARINRHLALVPLLLVCGLARAAEPSLLGRMLAGPLAGVEAIVFAERVGGTDHWYANFGRYSAPVTEYPPQRLAPGGEEPVIFKDGGRLCRWNLRERKLTVLLDDPAGGIRDPQVHYDGRTIVFAWRKGGREQFHLYEIQSDGTGLRQITDGDYDDIEPAWLPDGGIVFCSSRCRRYVNCWRTPVAVLYRCDRDGKNLRALSTNVEHDNTPWPLPDGRVLYMRWEYVDRNQLAFHHLWTANPDGTGQMVYYGNQFRDTAMLDAKPVPGTRTVVASFSPGHGVPEHMGHVTVVDPAGGPDDPAAARRISRDGRLYRDPLAVAEDCFLVADAAGIHVMDGAGHTERVYAPSTNAPRFTCHEPRPLAPRPREAVIAPRAQPGGPTGRMVLGDVYHGRNLEGVKRGEIKKLLVLEQLPKPVNFSGGMWPVSDGGTFTLARLLGTVPVDPDGTADFIVPAMRSLFFVALDENDLAVKRMQSFTTVQPGETAGCVGCHEHRTAAPPAGLAGRTRPPDRIEPLAGVPDVPDFPRDIQPVFDRHCVACHNPDRPEGRIDLCGDHTPIFAQSYYTLLQHALVSDGRNEPAGNRAPRSIGSSASPLLRYLDGRHYDARPSDAERRLVRLWIEAGAVYAGTYAALGSGMSPVEFPVEMIEQRCGACHGHQPPKAQIGKGLYFRFGTNGPALPLASSFVDLAKIRGAMGYYKFGYALPPQALCNLTRPEKSLLLRAPLAKSAGGLERCGQAVFAHAGDPAYRAMRERIEIAAQRHAAEKRFDLPGFRPNDYYIRALQRYGALPADLAPDAPVDPYAADRAYWQLVLAEPGAAARAP